MPTFSSAAASRDAQGKAVTKSSEVLGKIKRWLYDEFGAALYVLDFAIRRIGAEREKTLRTSVSQAATASSAASKGRHERN